jgi:hypothetical protein
VFGIRVVRVFGLLSLAHCLGPFSQCLFFFFFFRRTYLFDSPLVQDKSIKRFIVRNMVETAAHRDLKDASVYEGKAFD